MVYIKMSRNLISRSKQPSGQLHNENVERGSASRYQILDVAIDNILSSYTELAALTLQTPIALIALRNEHNLAAEKRDRDYFSFDSSNHTTRSIAIAQNELRRLQRVQLDPFLLTDKKTLQKARLNFGAETSLVSTDGTHIGWFVVINNLPRHYSTTDLEKLKQISTEVIKETELRYECSGIASLAALNARLTALQLRVDSLRANRLSDIPDGPTTFTK
jgi:hypothetical protein